MLDKTKNALSRFGVTRVIITAFFLSLVALTFILDLSFEKAISDVILRWCMNFVLVLAMVPGVLSGIGLNFGSPLGIVCGLLGGVLAIEFGFTGVTCLIMAILIGGSLAAVVGWLYGKLLNYVKGSEMMIATYLGFAFISLFCIVWVFLPVKNETLTMPMGQGVRTSIEMTQSFGHLLDEFLMIELGDFRIPVGYILVCLAVAWLVHTFLKSRAGIIMTVAGENTKFASSIGINVNRERILGTILSTVLSAVGILFYSQSYGFLQLYRAPLMMGFQAVAAVLIGGATTKTASITNAIIGTLLFNGILTLSMPVANALAPQSNLAEIVRIVVSNGIIIYALTKIGKED